MKTTAFSPADILLPKKGTDMSKWSVIACDQFTSQPGYWEETRKNVGESPSALDLILPEVYLEEGDVSKRIENIHLSMKKMLEDELFEEYKDSYIYVERVQSDGILRAGIVGKIDLEKYDYNKGSCFEVRATEATVIERIPPRVKIRAGAPLELPHIMILIDDEEKTVTEPLYELKKNFKKLYDFELMQGGGRVAGYLIDEKTKNEINENLCRLGNRENFERKYNVKNESVLLYAMGDGNHSLASAKAYYEQLKKENPDKDMTSHPARYALAEIVNLHSPALGFEAIHRIVSVDDKKKMLDEMKEELGLRENCECEQSFVIISGSEEKKYYITKKTSELTVGSVQNFLDRYLKENGGKIDYIHGEQTLRTLAKEEGSVGIILPCMDKSELFPTVIADGALPRKTFSMGHAEDKRYYVESRKISE